MNMLVLDIGNPFVHMVTVHIEKGLLPVDLVQPTIPGGINHPIIEGVLRLYLEESLGRGKSIEIRRGKARHVARDGATVHIYNF